MARSPLLHGLRLTLRHPRPLLWAFAFNAGVAWLSTSSLRVQYGNVLNNSLGAQRLVGGFDLGVAADATRRFTDGPQGALTDSFVGIPVYLILFFLLVPGTLLTYQANRSMRLSSLLLHGVQSFWSFLRIALLTAVIAGPILGLLNLAQTRWAKHVDEALTGRSAFLYRMAGVAIIFLVACGLRLYFDLVEIHTVALGEKLRPNNRPDRRVRRTLRPALHTLRASFVSNYLVFVFLALLGFAAVSLLGLSALHHLAQPRFWPTLLLTQAGLLFLIFTRFWQRAAETVHFSDVNPALARSGIFASPRAAGANPAPPQPLEPSMIYSASSFPTPNPGNPVPPVLPGPDSTPFPDPSPSPLPDPFPSPGPASPSFAVPGSSTFHRGPETPPEKDLLN